jgi:hypothetical protein
MAVASTTRSPLVLLPKLMATAGSFAVTTLTSPVPEKPLSRVTVLLALVTTKKLDTYQKLSAITYSNLDGAAETTKF